MIVTDPDTVEDDRHDATPALTVNGRTTPHTGNPADIPAVIGRDDPNAKHRTRILVGDIRISPRHLIVDLRDSSWVALPLFSAGSTGRDRKRDLSARNNNVVVDVRACSPTIGSRGYTLAPDIGQRITGRR